LVHDGDKYYKKLIDDDPAIEHAYGRTVSQLEEKIKEDATYSAFAKSIIRGYRDREWINEVF